jgi:lipopolysaccharide export system protein LptA
VKYQLKSTLVILAYLLLGIVLFVYSVTRTGEISLKETDKDAFDQQNGLLEQVQIFTTLKEKPHWKLKTQRVESFKQQEFHFADPDIYVYQDNDTFHVTSKWARYLWNKSRLEMKGDVSFESKMGWHKSQKARLALEGKRAFLSGEVKGKYRSLKNRQKMEISAGRAYLDFHQRRYRYRDEVAGELIPAARYLSSMKFTAGEINFIYDDGYILASQNVSFSRGLTDSYAKKGEFFLQNTNNKLKYYVLSDDVRLIERVSSKANAKVYRKAFAEKMEGYLNERRVVLTGAPRVLQGRDEIKGYRITLREDVDLLEVDDSASSFVIEKEERENETN